MSMRKRWLIGGVGVLVVAGVAAAVLMSSRGAASSVAPATQAAAKGDKAAALEFLANEVVQPRLGPMPFSVEFSGPLVAPGTAVVRAKAAGTLLSLNVAEGSRVKAGQLLGSVDLSELSSRVAERNAMLEAARAQLAGSVGTHEVSRLAPGMPVEVRVEGVEKPVIGSLARIAPAAEAGARSIGVTIALANPKETFRAGQYALAKVVLPDPVQRLTLPVAAVGNNGGQDHVWVIEGGALLRRAVTTGRRDNASGRIEVLKGVSSGAQVLAARFDNLREGSKAMVVAKSAAVASASAPAVK